MKEKSMTNWVCTIGVHALTIGLPILAFMTGVSWIDNFATFAIIIWGIIAGLLTALYGFGTLVAYVINDHSKKIDLYEALTKKSLLGYISRICTFIAPLVLVFTGHVAAGVWYLIWATLLVWIISISRKHYTEYKKNLVPKD
ncbi:hypothetical protein D3C80_131930 [compost metagenome]